MIHPTLFKNQLNRGHVDLKIRRQSWQTCPVRVTNFHELIPFRHSLRLSRNPDRTESECRGWGRFLFVLGGQAG